MWVLDKAQDKLGRKSIGECPFHLPMSKPEKRKELENLELVSIGMQSF